MLATNWINETCGTQEQFIYAHMENDFCPKNVEANHSPIKRPTIVFCYQNCSSDQENILKFEAEGWEFAKNLRSLELFIGAVRTILETDCFLTCSWRFLKSNILEQI